MISTRATIVIGGLKVERMMCMTLLVDTDKIINSFSIEIMLNSERYNHQTDKMERDSNHIDIRRTSTGFEVIHEQEKLCNVSGLIIIQLTLDSIELALTNDDLLITIASTDGEEVLDILAQTIIRNIHHHDCNLDISIYGQCALVNIR